MDEVGNCQLAIGKDYLAQVQGRRRAQRIGRGRGMGVAGYKILFAILVDPKILDLPVRAIAETAGVGKTAVAHTLQRLEEERLIGKGIKTQRVLETGTILDRWLVGFENLLRPRLLIGRFRTPDADPRTLEQRVERVLGDELRWAWGGGAAAMRLTDYYRGPRTILYVDDPPRDLHRQLKALPDANGPFTILNPPGPLALRGDLPQTVHPLLIYTDLLGEHEERAREAAQQIHDRFLRNLL